MPPRLVLDDEGLTVTNCGTGELSPGCQACKAGAWVCVFVGLRCNARCAFCPQPAIARQIDDNEFGSEWVDRLLEGLKTHGARVRGLSMSGGEPLYYPDIVRKIVSFSRANLPGVYLWLYTNGVFATPERQAELRAQGLDELRFNLAATHFNLRTMRHVEHAAKRVFPWVSIEVPVYPVTYHHLVELEKLSALSDMGVKQINLGQLFSGSPSSHVMKNFGAFFPPGASPSAACLELRQRTLDIFEYAEKKRLPIRINDCSDDAKRVQQRARAEKGGADLAALMALAYPRPDPPRAALTPPVDAERAEGAWSKTLAPALGDRQPEPSDVVVLRYMGWNAEGEVIDTSYDRGLDGIPMAFTSISPALAGGVRAMRVGEKRRFWLPSGGEKYFVFDMELVGISTEGEGAPAC